MNPRIHHPSPATILWNSIEECVCVCIYIYYSGKWCDEGWKRNRKGRTGRERESSREAPYFLMEKKKSITVCWWYGFNRSTGLLIFDLQLPINNGFGLDDVNLAFPLEISLFNFRNKSHLIKKRPYFLSLFKMQGQSLHETHTHRRPSMILLNPCTTTTILKKPSCKDWPWGTVVWPSGQKIPV